MLLGRQLLLRARVRAQAVRPVNNRKVYAGHIIAIGAVWMLGIVVWCEVRRVGRWRS